MRSDCLAKVCADARRIFFELGRLIVIYTETSRLQYRRAACLRPSLRLLQAVATAGAILSWPGPAAAVVDCTGTVESLSLQMDTYGTVTISLSGGPSYVNICYVDGASVNGISPTVCRTMYGTLALAKTTGKKVLMRFHNHSSCTAIPPWAHVGQMSWTQVLLD